MHSSPTHVTVGLYGMPIPRSGSATSSQSSSIALGHKGRTEVGNASPDAEGILGSPSTFILTLHRQPKVGWNTVCFNQWCRAPLKAAPAHTQVSAGDHIAISTLGYLYMGHRIETQRCNLGENASRNSLNI